MAPQLSACWRLGVLQEDVPSTTTHEMSPASRGEVVVRQALLHPFITDSKLAALIVPTLSPPHSPSLPLTPSLVFALTTPPRKHSLSLPTARPSAPTRAQTVPSPRQPLLSALDKRRLAIQVHALYILALQAWPTQKEAAQTHWQYIVDLSTDCGGSLGSKEGDAIVGMALLRLKGEVDDSWKAAKARARRSSVAGSSIASDESASTSTSRGGRARSGDALVEMARERELLEMRTQALEKERSAASDDASTSSITIRGTLRKALSQSTLGVSATSRTSYFDAHHTLAQSPSHAAPLKVLLRVQDDYPSPPETPESSPPSSANNSEISQASTSASRQPIIISLDEGPANTLEETLDRNPPRRVRRVDSTASFQPPRLLRRIASSASISTVPPNFGRPRVGGSSWQELGEATVSGIVVDGATSSRRPVGPMRAVSSPLAARPPIAAVSPFSSISLAGLRDRLTSLRPVNLFKRAPAIPSATSLLRKVLVQDDASAGPGMYWADPDMEEHQEVSPESPPTPPVADTDSEPPSVNSSRSTSPSPSPPTSRSSSRHSSRTRLSHQRSFVDPTTPSTALPVRSRAASPIPLLVTTPPTPQKDHLLPPRPSRRTRKKSLPPSSSLFSTSPTAVALPPLDPVFARLERDSTLGIEASCDECGKVGSNFSACPRCEGRYCSRGCRVKSGGGRHACK